ncbi:hypothetical protein WUBG_07517 [Wuchereria bancrofti]|uniref:Uncharacterized protein n=1 Tax=Wuchereria bancrofti TaxID=6293 RepID=J9F2M9_WUCBA|nr:hypothetical protein WUBG_07517 [Wuchereria bancrofti]
MKIRKLKLNRKISDEEPIIGSFGYKLSAMGSGFLSSHFSQQSVLKLPAIIVITDASMNMKRLMDLQRIFCGAQLVEFLICQSFIFLTKRWELCEKKFIRERFEANWYEIFVFLITKSDEEKNLPINRSVAVLKSCGGNFPADSD